MPGGENYKKALYVEAVFKKYGTTEEVFDSSNGMGIPRKYKNIIGNL